MFRNLRENFSICRRVEFIVTLVCSHHSACFHGNLLNNNPSSSLETEVTLMGRLLLTDYMGAEATR